ncbi:MAG: hypothetical protein M5R36_10330 [Deltaproteobacteria bacterium]|nr:hypothetical protein [Deltaproteobacteria bacterium]
MIGKPFLPGGIVNSATGALFTYTVQCEISKGCAGFPKLVTAPEFNPDVAMRHMDLYSVSHIIAYWKKTKNAMDKQPDWELARRVKDYNIYRRKGGAAPWVFVPENRPAFLRTDNWKERAIEWFSVPNVLEEPFVFLEPGEEIPDPELTQEFDLAAYFGVLAESRSDPTEIPCWSMLGPFFHEPDIENPYEWNPVDDREEGLRPGRPMKGVAWRSFFREGKIDVDTMLNPSHHLVVYAYAGLYADKPGPARLLLANDDEMVLFFNNQRVKESPRHEVERPAIADVELREGRNDLIIKLNQGVGGAFYHARVQTPDGDPVPGLRFGPDPLGPAPATPATFAPTPKNCDVNITRFDDQEVRFTTSCLGEPHIVKYSWFMNWKVKGARKIYQVSPNFMLVYPRENEVVLTYGSVGVDIFSRILTLIGYIALAFLFFRSWRERKTESAS